MCAPPGLGSFSILSSCKDPRPGLGTPGSRNHCPVVKDLLVYSRKWSSSAFLPRRVDVPNLLGSGGCGMCARPGLGSFSILWSCKDRRPGLGAPGSRNHCPVVKDLLVYSRKWSSSGFLPRRVDVPNLLGCGTGSCVLCARPGPGSFNILWSCKDRRPGLGAPGSRNHCLVINDLPAYSRKWSSTAFLPRRVDVPNLLGSGGCGICARPERSPLSILWACFSGVRYMHVFQAAPYWGQISYVLRDGTTSVSLENHYRLSVLRHFYSSWKVCCALRQIPHIQFCYECLLTSPPSSSFLKGLEHSLKEIKFILSL